MQQVFFARGAQDKATGMKEILQSERGQFEPAGISTTIGLDLGDRWSRYCVVDAGGAVTEEDRGEPVRLDWSIDSARCHRCGRDWKEGHFY